MNRFRNGLNLVGEFFNFYRIVFLCLSLIAFFLGYLELKNPKKAYANCNINMADWNESQVNQCLISGGTIALVATDGVYGKFYNETAEIVSDFNDGKDDEDKMTIEVRIYNGNTTPTEEQITAVIAIMQDPSNDIGVPTILRVNNEPNNIAEDGGSSLEEMVENIVEAQYYALQEIEDSGGGIYLASEMIDMYSDKFGADIFDIWELATEYIQSNQDEYPGIDSYHDLYDIYSINGYFGSDQISEENELLTEILDEVIANGKLWRFSEFGYIGSTGVVYDTEEIISNLEDLAVFLSNNEKYFLTFAGLNIFTNNPVGSGSADMSSILEYLESISDDFDLLSIFSVLSSDATRNSIIFEDWIKDLLAEGILVICCTEGEGTCSKDDAEKFLGYAAPGECNSDFAMPGENEFACFVGNEVPEEGDFRPEPCDNCKLDVPNPMESCAESPRLEKEVKWSCPVSEDGDCGNKRIIRKDWSVQMSLDTTETKVPFVGYKEIVENENAPEPNKTASLNYYLADYIEGTALFDERQYDMTDTDDQQALIRDAGVFRKLAPLELQNNLREKLIMTGVDYEISDGDIKASMNDWKSRPDPYPEGRFPPDMENDSDYEENYKNWINTKWGKLWNRIPLFSREDAPGLVRITLEHDPGEIIISDNGEIIDSATAEFPLAVPHVTRLYEASKNLNELLMPNIMANKNESYNKSIGGVKIASVKSQEVKKVDNRIQSQVLAESTSRICSEEHNVSTMCDGENPLEDDNDNDSICGNISFEAKFENHPKSIDNYEDKCEDRECIEWIFFGGDKYCAKYESAGGTVTFTRDIEVKTELPYLEEIWKLLVDENEMSVFSMFTGGDLNKFPADDAVSTVKYQISGGDGVSINKEEGDFFFPYLGGIQRAKKCISEELLVPEELQIGDKCTHLFYDEMYE